MRTLFVLMAAGALCSCGDGNHLLFGEVEAQAGSHMVRVTDCYRWRVPPPQRMADAGGRASYRFMPCKDADVQIRGGELEVNGRSYGPIGEGDGVLVDHGRVQILARARPK